MNKQTYWAFDVETTTINKGDPYHPDNKLVALGIYKPINKYSISYKDNIEFDIPLYEFKTNILIGCNIKFDLAWLERINIDTRHLQVYDIQLAEFLISNQTKVMPSLNYMAEKYLGQQKIDKIKLEYWERKCSCHVQIADNLLTEVTKVLVNDATIEHVKLLIERGEMKKSVHGESLIQKSMLLLKSAALKNYVQTLLQELSIIETKPKTYTKSQMLSMIDSWHKQTVLYVEKLATYTLTTIIQQEKLETDCVSHVIQLWHILNEPIGWTEHTSICSPTSIDTWFIPEEELTEYLKEDLRLTYEVFIEQEQILKETGKWNLFRLQCMDLVVLNNMEWNGIPFNKEESIKRGNELNAEIKRTRQNIISYSKHPDFNCASGDYISCLLYGGIISHTYRIPIGIYKTGDKQGQVRNKVFTTEYIQERLVEPLKGSELKKEGYWSTDEYTLTSLKPKTKEVKELIKNILALSKLEKLRDTYYLGIPKLIDKKGWKNAILHGKLNQCIAKTGRLSASEPNQQNFDPNLKELCVSEYVH